MRRVGVYPGSFTPWHPGHQDILDKARRVFDEVVVLQLCNPEKPHPVPLVFEGVNSMGRHKPGMGMVFVDTYEGLLRDYLGEHPEIQGIVRGLRNGRDLDESKEYQYWNEDLGIKVPFVHFISDRTLVHYSSSAIRGLKGFGVTL